MGAQPDARIGSAVETKGARQVHKDSEQGPIARVPVWAVATIMAFVAGSITIYATHESRLAVVEAAMLTEREARKEQAALLTRMADQLDTIKTAVYELRARGGTP